jgi:predicted DNA binding CopG/RHH family protein
MKKIPHFRNEEEESVFWSEADSTEYIDWNKAKSISFVNLKPSTRSISIRLPESLLNRLKIEANKNDIPYQSLIKMLLVDGLNRNAGKANK